MLKELFFAGVTGGLALMPKEVMVFADVWGRSVLLPTEAGFFTDARETGTITPPESFTFERGIFPELRACIFGGLASIILPTELSRCRRMGAPIIIPPFCEGRRAREGFITTEMPFVVVVVG